MMYKIYVLSIIVAICSCNNNRNKETANDNTPDGIDSNIVTTSIEKSTYLALGDSYTIGTSVELQNNFPTQLIDSLASRNYIVEDTDLLAMNGWTTTDLLNGLNTASFKSKKYELVTLLIGVNNQYQNKPFSLFDIQFKELVDQAINFADGNIDKVVVLSIPDYSVTPYVSAENKTIVATDLKKYNTRKREICESKGVTFIDITPISKLAAVDSSLLADDNLHPSAKMYSLWVSKMIDTVLDKI